MLIYVCCKPSDLIIFPSIYAYLSLIAISREKWRERERERERGGRVRDLGRR